MNKGFRMSSDQYFKPLQAALKVEELKAVDNPGSFKS
jgi:hypothetical protein